MSGKVRELRDILAQAAAITIVGLAFLMVLLGGLAVWFVSMSVFGALLDPHVPDGLPSVIILIISLIPPLFYAGVVVSLYEKYFENEE